jgi:alkaline phosphatase
MLSGITRRGLLQSGSAGVLAAFPGSEINPQRKPFSGKHPKNIIFCVADGMAMSTVTMSNYFQQITHGRSSYWMELINSDFAISGLQNTRSLNSLVTDSAAASSAWGSGRHIWNGQLNAYPDGTELRPLASLLHEAGINTGLVTTTTITHATPSGFAISCINRDLEGLIAEKHLESNVSVLMGGGARSFSAQLRPDKRDLFAEFAAKGYRVLRNRKELLEYKGVEKTLGIFHDGHMPYTVDHKNSTEYLAEKPTLSEMTAAALRILKSSSRGFVLQVEGGKVDHGGHANDLAALLYDQMAFEEAVKTAVDFALKDRETLVIITADHATGGPALNGAGFEYIESTEGLRTVARMKSSYETIFTALGKTPTASQIRDVINQMLGIELKMAEAQAVADAMGGKSPFALSSFYGGPQATLAMMLGNYTKVTWTSQNHTSDHVLVTAVGPWKEAAAGLTPNVRFFDLMLAAYGLKWNNPTMSFEEASRYQERLKKAVTPDMRARWAVNCAPVSEHWA